MKEENQNKKQIIMTISMIIVSVLVISVTSYAWFKITNTPKITGAEFVADTLGDLKISDAVKDNSGNYTPVSYVDSINLFEAGDLDKRYLSPVTTEDGISFYKPVYLEGKVDSLQLLNTSVEAQNKELHTKYMYEKKFFLKAGNQVAADKAKYYDIHFIGMTQSEILNNPASIDTTTGTYIIPNGTDNESAANAIRISFEVNEAAKADATTEMNSSVATTSTSNVVIYEPNSNSDNGGSDANMVTYVNGNNEKFGEYKTLKQFANKSFDVNNNNAELKAQSQPICTIKEGVDVEITLRMWVEGMDKDCMNDIAADKMIGQIQFISSENLDHITN